MYYLLFLIIIIAAAVIINLFLKQKCEEEKLLRASNLTLFRVKVPREVKLKEGEQQKTFADLLSVSEQLFASFHGSYQKKVSRFTGSQPTISLEITSFRSEGEQQKTFADLLSVSEQLFASFHGSYQKKVSRFTGSQPTISLEITSF